MKKYLKMSFFLLLISMMIVMTGCSARSTITGDDFKKAAEGAGYTVTDNSSQATNVECFFSAADDSGTEIHFVAVASDSDAKTLYTNFKGQIQAGDNKGKTLDSDAYAKYSVTNGELYYYVSRIDKTVLYAKTTTSKQADVEKFVGSIKY